MLHLPQKDRELPVRFRFIERKTRATQRARLILQELIDDANGEQRWRDVPLVRE